MTININTKILDEEFEFLKSFFEKGNPEFIEINKENANKTIDDINKLFNIYVVYDEKNIMKYVGQSKKKYCLQRLKQHFVKKSEKTNSIYNKIKEGRTYRVKVCIIEPEELRHYFEIKLIREFKKYNIWNIQN